MGKPGLIDSIRFQTAANVTKSLDSDDTEIAAAATGLNFHEVITIMGVLPLTMLGFEAAGTVICVLTYIVEVGRKCR